MNKVILLGRLTRDIELRKTPNQATVGNFSIAVNKRMANGENGADFINCVVWNKTAEIMSQYLAKGSQVAIVGRLSTRNYEDQTGKKVYITEVIVDEFDFCGAKSGNASSNNGGFVSNNNPVNNGGMDYNDNSYSSNGFDDKLNISEDDLPF
ncbi:MAG: single-stranded DNA-binding protein [Erysipelotrichaceae bacterium]